MEQHNDITITDMLQKLDNMCSRQSVIIQQTLKLKTEWEQLEEDIALLQDMIIYQKNKLNRQNE
jgi:hypothetical protein